jgi:hypothetical protein
MAPLTVRHVLTFYSEDGLQASPASLYLYQTTRRQIPQYGRIGSARPVDVQAGVQTKAHLNRNQNCHYLAGVSTALPYDIARKAAAQSDTSGVRYWSTNCTQHRGAQIPGARSPWRPNFVKRLVTSVHSQIETSFTFPSDSQNFEVAPEFLKYLCTPALH